MAKDYAKMRALLQEAIKCIGDEDEGMDPKLPKQEQQINDGGQDSPLKFLPEDDGTEGPGEEKGEYDDPPEVKKKKKESSMAMMSQMLAKKFNK